MGGVKPMILKKFVTFFNLINLPVTFYFVIY